MRKYTLIVLVLLGAFVFYLPQIASLNWVKTQIEANLETQLGGSVSIDQLSLNWLGGQVCQQVSWSDPNTGLAILADKVTINSNLIDCIRYKEKPLDVTIEGTSLDITAGIKYLKKTQKDLHIDFSPIRAQLSGKKVAYDRIEIEINNKMKAYSWGELNLNNSNLEVTLGLPQQILGKIFKECRNLPEDFILEIPISCNIGVKSIQKELLWYLLKNYTKVSSLHKKKS